MEENKGELYSYYVVVSQGFMYTNITDGFFVHGEYVG